MHKANWPSSIADTDLSFGGANCNYYPESKEAESMSHNVLMDCKKPTELHHLKTKDLASKNSQLLFRGLCFGIEEGVEA